MPKDPLKCNDGTHLIVTSVGGVQMTDTDILVTCCICGHRKSVFECGFRKMPDGKLRNQPHCIPCRKKTGPWAKGRGCHP